MLVCLRGTRRQKRLYINTKVQPLFSSAPNDVRLFKIVAQHKWRVALERVTVIETALGSIRVVVYRSPADREPAQHVPIEKAWGALELAWLANRKDWRTLTPDYLEKSLRSDAAPRAVVAAPRPFTPLSDPPTDAVLETGAAFGAMWVQENAPTIRAALTRVGPSVALANPAMRFAHPRLANGMALAVLENSRILYSSALAELRREVLDQWPDLSAAVRGRLQPSLSRLFFRVEEEFGNAQMQFRINRLVRSMVRWVSSVRERFETKLRRDPAAKDDHEDFLFRNVKDQYHVKIGPAPFEPLWLQSRDQPFPHLPELDADTELLANGSALQFVVNVLLVGQEESALRVESLELVTRTETNPAESCRVPKWRAQEQDDWGRDVLQILQD